MLVTDSLGRFAYDPAKGAIAARIREFFSRASLDSEVNLRTNADPEARKVSELSLELQREENKNIPPTLGGAGSLLRSRILDPYDADKARALRSEVLSAQMIEKMTRQDRFDRHLKEALHVRLGVLEVLLRNLPPGKARDDLVGDIRKIFAAVQMPLDVKGDPPLVVFMDDPLLEKEVTDRLLARLRPEHTDIADALIRTYHDFVQGADGNKLFGDAYKALEKLARRLSSRESLLLSDKKEIRKHFPNLHATIYTTIDMLAAHAGDEGRHGGKGPDEFELRYLLSHVCNTALLLVEASESRKPVAAQRVKETKNAKRVEKSTTETASE